MLDNLELVIERAKRRVDAKIDMSASAYQLHIFRDRMEHGNGSSYADEVDITLLRNHRGLVL
nr:hypothetical protein [Nitrosomonas nitrosa]